MSDLQRSDPNAIVLKDEHLRRKDQELDVSRKLNQIKGLEVRIDHLKTVDIKQAELQIEVLKKEITETRLKLNSITVR